MNFNLLLDAEGRFTFVNKFFETWLGYHLTELEGEYLHEYLPASKAGLLTGFLNNPQLHDNLYLECVVLNGKDGGLRPANITFTHLPSHVANRQVMVSIYARHEPNCDVISEIKKGHSSFFERHPFGIVHLTTRGKITKINSQLRTDLGYDLDMLQQTPFFDIVQPQYYYSVLRNFKKAVKQGRASTFDIQVLTTQQMPLHVNFTVVPVVYQDQTLEVYLVIKNISEHIELQQKLKKLSIVADKATNGVVVLDSHFEIELINDGFTQMSGYTREDVMGKHMGEILKMEGRNTAAAKTARENLINGIALEQEVKCYKKDGTPYWNLLKLTPIMNEQGRMEMCITVHTDVTEKKKTEMELRLLADDLYRQNKELHQFAYIVSHNMRSPVANIVGLANLMEVFKDDPETQEQTLKELARSVNNLDTVIKDLTYILTVNNASKELLKEPVIFQDMLQQVLIDLQPQILMTDADITIPGKPLVMHTNRAYVHSIFYNLISNALKYKSRQRPYIKIDFYMTQEHTVIYVADNGKGIDLKKHSNDLFKPYKRFDFKVEGKGLGLFLVKSHVEALGGQLTVKSELNKGSTFYIQIPFI